MDFSQIDPNVLILAGITAPIAWGMWNQLNRRIGRVESFLTEKFGDQNQHFKPGNSGR